MSISHALFLVGVVVLLRRFDNFEVFLNTALVTLAVPLLALSFFLSLFLRIFNRLQRFLFLLVCPRARYRNQVDINTKEEDARHPRLIRLSVAGDRESFGDVVGDRFGKLEIALEEGDGDGADKRVNQVSHQLPPADLIRQRLC